MEFFLTAVSITLIVLTVLLIVVFFMLYKSIAACASAWSGLRSDLSPLLGDLKEIGQNVAAASESLKHGLERANHMTEALGRIGDDLEEGRRAVKEGIERVGQVAAPWLGFLKLFQRK